MMNGGKTTVSKKNAVENLDKLMEKMENIKNLTFETDHKGNDLESKLDNLTNQLKNAFDTKSELIWENGKPEKFKKCRACDELIKSETILAGPDHFHQECFTCEHCGQALGDNFYSVDNKNYCQTHKEAALDKCSSCEESITEGGLQVEDKRFHLHCFQCSECRVVLDGNYYISPSGDFVCPADYMETLPKCNHCHLPIKDKILKALDTQFHPACFRCSLCDKGLDGVPFILTDNSSNCVDCYKTYKAAKCVRCGEAAVGGGSPEETDLVCNGRTYHRRCYTCLLCSMDLYGQFVCAYNSDIICFNCDVKLRSN